jgi:hypothetical protein
MCSSIAHCGKHLRGVVLALLADELDITPEAVTGQPSRYEFMQQTAEGISTMRKNLRLFSCHHDGGVRRDTSAAERSLR